MSDPFYDRLGSLFIRVEDGLPRIMGERPLSPPEPSNAELLDAEVERTAAEESAKDMASDEWAEAHPWAMEWLLQHDADALLAIARAAILADEHPRSYEAKAELTRAVDAAKQAWIEHRVENRRDYR